MKKKISVEWTGSYPCQCYGIWNIVIGDKSTLDFYKKYENDLMLRPLLLETLKTHMNTKRKYNKWYFGKNYDVIWEEYVDGLDFEEWYQSETKTNLEEIFEIMGIKLEIDGWKILYDEINEKDWRYNSCGGCI